MEHTHTCATRRGALAINRRTVPEINKYDFTEVLGVGPRLYGSEKWNRSKTKWPTRRTISRTAEKLICMGD